MARQPKERDAPARAEKPATDGRDEEAEARNARVGDHLRGIYDDILAERVPDSFEELLRKLR